MPQWYTVRMGKKMGRPVKPKGERKSVVISLRLKADEIKDIDAAARADGKKRSVWMRKVLTAAARALQ